MFSHETQNHDGHQSRNLSFFRDSLIAGTGSTYGDLGRPVGFWGVFMARLYGASLIGNLLLTWFAKNDSGSEAQRASVLGLFVYDAIGFIVALMAVLAGIMNPLGWVIVGLLLFLALGFGYFQFAKPANP